MTITRAEIDALTDAEAWGFLDTRCAEIYQTHRWQAAFARDIGINAPAVSRWRYTRPPAIYLFYVDARARLLALTEAMDAMREALERV
jgi:hypothetical protein